MVELNSAAIWMCIRRRLQYQHRGALFSYPGCTRWKGASACCTKEACELVHDKVDESSSLIMLCKGTYKSHQQTATSNGKVGFYPPPPLEGFVARVRQEVLCHKLHQASEE